MLIKLSVSDVQDLAEILFEKCIRPESSMHAEIDRLLERFDIDRSLASTPYSSAAKNRFRELIKNINGTDKFIKVVSYLIETKISPQDTETISDLSRIFAPYGITISASDNNLTLQSTLMISQKLLEEERYWLEENAPEKTITHLRQAHEKLGRGEWAETLSACRNALESLTKSGSFTGFINELVEKEIIAKGEEQRMKDAELLKTIYGFCSTIGSHAAGQVLANEQRARMGLLITEAAIYFLCRQMEEARSKGICR